LSSYLSSAAAAATPPIKNTTINISPSVVSSARSREPMNDYNDVKQQFIRCLYHRRRRCCWSSSSSLSSYFSSKLSSLSSRHHRLRHP
jgi:hypothetical protein